DGKRRGERERGGISLVHRQQCTHTHTHADTHIRKLWYFKPTFWALINKHAPMRRLRVSGKDSPWFNESLSSSARERDNTCAKAKKKNDPRDWAHYRQLDTKAYIF